MNATLSRYSTALLPLAVLVLGVLDAADKAGANLLGWQTITQLVILLATTGAAFWLPLVPGKWAGALKTGAAIVGAIVSALVATVPDGHFTSATLILFLTAAVKAVAVQVGVSIRTDTAKVNDATEDMVTTVPDVEETSDVTIPDVDMPGALEQEQSGTVDADAPKHSAE